MPFPNEHSCRLKQPGQYTRFARKNCEQKHDGKCIDVIYGIKQGKSEIQALRYPKGSWTESAARNHCSGRGGSFEAASGKTMKHKHMTANLIMDSVKPVKTKTRDTGDSYTAVAVIGDQFWNEGKKGFGGKAEFALASALKRDHKTMDGKFHNLDHARTIDSLVGVHENTEYKNKTKQMIIHIYPDEKFGGYNRWKSFIDACKRTGYTPNVSIECFAECEDMPASELPEGTDYAKHGIGDEDMIEVEVGYRFLGAATVWRGACSSDDGCGIILEQSRDDNGDDEPVDPNLDEQSPLEYTPQSCNCKELKLYPIQPETTVNWNFENVTFTNEKKEVGKMTDDEKEDETKEEPEGEKPKEEPKKEPEAEPEGEPEKENEPEKAESAKIKALQSKLVNCGELRANIEKQLEELKNQVSKLEKENDELKTALNKPVTKKNVNEQSDNVGVRVLELLKRGR